MSDDEPVITPEQRWANTERYRRLVAERWDHRLAEIKTIIERDGLDEKVEVALFNWVIPGNDSEPDVMAGRIGLLYERILAAESIEVADLDVAWQQRLREGDMRDDEPASTPEQRWANTERYRRLVAERWDNRFAEIKTIIERDGLDEKVEVALVNWVLPGSESEPDVRAGRYGLLWERILAGESIDVADLDAAWRSARR